MDKTRTLPPLVRGKVTGVLNFFVDEIKIFRNNLLTDDFDLVLQVQWWGECLPAFIRPKKHHVQDRSCKNIHSLESYYYFVKYEIKTTLDLFKQYLKSCERLEFCVLERGQKYVIGSAFLRELCNLLSNNNKPIKMSIFNYLGIVIGEVAIHINFLEKLQYKCDLTQNEITLNGKNSCLLKKLEKIEEEEISKKIKSNYFTLGEKTLSYDIYSKVNFPKKKFCMHFEPPKDKHYSEKSMPIKNLAVTQLISNKYRDLLTEQEVNMNQKSEFNIKDISHEYLPEIKTSSDSSKVLYFGVSSRHPNSKISVNLNSGKVAKKFNSNSVKCKSKSKNAESSFPFDQNFCNKKPNLKKSESCKNLSEKVCNLKRKKPDDFKDSLLCYNSVPKILPYSKQSDCQNITLKKSSNYKILNYLLGSDMSKDDEEIALNNFKKISPCYNLVDSISQLCLNSNENMQISENGSCTKLPLNFLELSHLNFDFTNPIERNYYKKFFLKSNNNADFEVAEFLNLPENRIMFDKYKFNEMPSQKNESQNNMCKNLSECLHVDKEVKKTKINENHSQNKICVTNKTSNCARCKYFKKLDELDTIIESLKHFEQKMLQYDKDLQLNFKQNPDVSVNETLC